MKALSGVARLYILGMVVAGAEAAAWAAMNWSVPERQLVLAGALAVAASVALVLKVEGATRKSSYNLSLVVYALTVVLLGPAPAAAVVAISCLVDWAFHRYPWYIQAFNIASLLVGLTAAALAADAVTLLRVAPEVLSVARYVVLTAVFVLLNHLFVGIVIMLARGESLRESGVFDFMPLAMDASLFGLGTAGACIAAVNPWASLLVGPPLALLYFTLRIPQLERQAVTDAKTGLYNARHFNDALKRELERAERYDRPLAVVMADLDLLRNINNRYGHVAGDIVLKGVADILSESVREYDIVSRFGGEEFAILMGETSMRDAQALLERIRLAIEEAEFRVPTNVEPIGVTMSFGVAERREGQTALDLIHVADLALYQAKCEGRNRIRVAGPRAVAGRTIVEGESLEPTEAEAAIAAAAGVPVAALAAVADQVVRAHPADELVPDLPETAEAVQESIPGQPVWMSEALIVIVAVTAALMLAVTMPGNLDVSSWPALAAFTALVFGAELLSVEIHARDASISTAIVPFVGGSLLFGAPAVAAMAVAMSFGAFIKHRSQASRFVFNTSSHLIAGLAAVGLVRALPLAHRGHIGEALLAGALGTLTVYVVTTALVSLAIGITTEERPERIWTERFRWLAPHYLALSVVAAASLVAYAGSGVIGAVVLMSPMLILRFGQEQYVEHTKDMVRRLRTTNRELGKRTARIERLNQELLVALTNLVELRDPYMLGHSQYVGKYAEHIAERMGLPSHVRDTIAKAGLLHDIGKLGVPEALLLKEGRLEESEFAVVKRHCGIGGDLVAQCSSLAPVVEAVRHHHERYDGRGYPSGLRGEQIPIEARILAVADSVEAMASDRPYRHGMRPEAIVEEVRAKAGSQFDPTVAQVFCDIVAEEGYGIIVNSALKVAQAAAEACDPSKLVVANVAEFAQKLPA